MAFRFNWPEFDSDFYADAKAQLETALNKGEKPKKIVDHITVKDLCLGTVPPELEILEIGELTTDTFRGIFKLTYKGDAHIVLQTKVQANPMHVQRSESPRHTRPTILAAAQPLVVPMLLKISDLQLRGIVVLVVSKTKGITLVFKNDPLESILVSSTFDSVTALRDFLQREIETQIRKLLQEDMPVMIHNLSLKHMQARQEQELQERVETEKKKCRPSPLSVGRHSLHSSNTSFDDISEPDMCYSPRSLCSSTPSVSPSILTPTDNKSFFDCVPPPSMEPWLRQASHIGYFDTPNLPFNQSCIKETIPMTTANLSTWNRQFSHRYTSPLYEYTSIPAMHSHQADMLSLDESESDESASCIDNLSTICSTDGFSPDDADAPWYAKAGLDALCAPSVNLHQSISLQPSEHVLTRKLACLTRANHTLSPFLPAIQHSTCRSIPHVVSGASLPKHNSQKIPRRRIIRLQGFNML
ncbi:hypothetical protein CLU79DRAFT_742840 [Phycomyces nitens]|nr:hypothetical protein CLU79DRAFT_742840 [Phycomyces nitens]